MVYLLSELIHYIIYIIQLLNPSTFTYFFTCHFTVYVQYIQDTKDHDCLCFQFRNTVSVNPGGFGEDQITLHGQFMQKTRKKTFLLR